MGIGTSIGVGVRPGRRTGKALSSWLAVIMLVGTLGYVVRDNFHVGAVGAQEGARTSEAEALDERSRACLERGDATAARDHALEAIELAPEFLPAHLSLAVALARTGDLDGAKAALETAERLDPEHPGVESTRALLQPR